MVLLTFCFFLDATIENPFTGRVPFEIGYAGALSVIWLVSNSFSTSRWRHIPLACNSISKSFCGGDRLVQECSGIEILYMDRMADFVIPHLVDPPLRDG